MLALILVCSFTMPASAYIYKVYQVLNQQLAPGLGNDQWLSPAVNVQWYSKIRVFIWCKQNCVALKGNIGLTTGNNTGFYGELDNFKIDSTTDWSFSQMYDVPGDWINIWIGTVGLAVTPSPLLDITVFAGW